MLDTIARWLRERGLRTTPDPIAQVIVFDSTPWCSCREEAFHLLSHAERERANRFRHAHHRDTYVLAHAVWRLALAEALGVAPGEFVLASEPSGRPFIPGTDLATSLSHSNSHVAIALAHAPCIGVDIERTPARFAWHDLARMVCTPAESATLQDLEPEARSNALLALWTRKEALLKAFGLGLRESPSGMDVDAGVAIAAPLAAAYFPACVVHPLPASPDFVGALAAPASITAFHWHCLSAATLPDGLSSSEAAPPM